MPSPSRHLLRAAAGLMLALLLVAHAPADAAAQVVSTVERKLLPFRLGPLSDVPRTFWEGLTFLREEEDRQRALRAEISFGLSGDEAGDRSLFKLNTGISLARGAFPSEVSVVSRLYLQYRDGQLQEDVTSLRITYDYHRTRNLQYFSFAERFTDSFMSIRQRYEIGFGARLGMYLGRIDTWRAVSDHLAAVRDGLPVVEAALPAVRSVIRAEPGAQRAGFQDVTPMELAAFRSAIDNIQTALVDREARVFLGISAALFAEIESADLEVVSLPVDGSSESRLTSRLSLGSTQRYRVSLRPTIKYRPMPDVQITVFPYFKLPLDAPHRVTTADGSRRLDYRRDVLSDLTWLIRREQTGLESVEFVLTYNHLFDNVPPALPEAIVLDTLEAGRIFVKTSAERSHRVVALSLRLRW